MISTTGKAGRVAHGLTLTEIMVVMAIIIAIASVAVVASRGLWGYGQRHGTIAALQALMNSIEAYKADYGGYVPRAHGANAPIDSNAYPTHYGIKNLYVQLMHDKRLEWLGSKYVRADAADPDGNRVIVDGYGRPFVYDMPTYNGLMDHKPPLGADYILYSLGPDGRATPDPADKSGDDIRNYREWR